MRWRGVYVTLQTGVSVRPCALCRGLSPEDVLMLSTELTDRFRKPSTDATT